MAVAAGLMMVVGLSGVLAGCSGGDDSGASAALVVVPNDVLADVVERVGCVGDIEVAVGPLESDDGRVPAIELALDDGEGVAGNGGATTGDGAESTAGTTRVGTSTDGGQTFVVAIPDVVSTLDGSDGDIDSAIWMDPSRLAALVPAIAGALVAGAGLDAELVDRCVARVLTEIEQVDVAIAERLAELGPTDRIIDVSEPGVVYFASRYDLAPSTGPLAVEAGAALAVDDLDGAESYDDMMLANADRIVAVFE
jgi:ABC-type Zn uptake system ZnuABC Zn-binding protein ZnuA